MAVAFIMTTVLTTSYRLKELIRTWTNFCLDIPCSENILKFVHLSLPVISKLSGGTYLIEILNFSIKR